MTVGNAQRIKIIQENLAAAFSPERLEVVDESHKHAGHEGARSGKGHFDVTIVSADFENKSLLERHRMVYAALGDFMESDIHALAIKANTPDEV